MALIVSWTILCFGFQQLVVRTLSLCSRFQQLVVRTLSLSLCSRFQQLVVRTLSLCSRFQQLVVWTLSLSLCQLLKEQVAEYTLKSLGTGEVPTTLAYISALVVVHGLFGLRGSERFGRAIHRYPPFPCPQ